ncbi:hypothetical protein LOTGIDRAFT_87184, partial [Lottia gigantea]
TINTITDKQPHCNIFMNGVQISVMIDSGSSVRNCFLKIQKDTEKKLKLNRSTKKLYAYGSKVPIETDVTLKAKFKDKVKEALLYVVKNATGNLLSYQTAVDLRLLHIAQINSVVQSSEILSILKDFEHIFSGFGKIKDKLVHLHIDKDVVPKQQQHRRIPFHVRKDVEAELKRLELLDIIEKVTGPTP